MIVDIVRLVLLVVNGWFFGYGVTAFYYDHRNPRTTSDPTPVKP